MTFDDAVRIGMFLLFGVGAGFMVGTNVLAFMVLRPPKRLGFLWWHVTAISVSFTLVSLVGMRHVLDTLNEGVTVDGWTVLFGLGLTLFAVAQIIIFNVERQRYADKHAVARVLSPGRSPYEEK